MDSNASDSPTPSRKEDDLIADAMNQAEAASISGRTSDLVAGAPAETGTPIDNVLPADVFPGYELLRQLHEGGQGVVYLALQKSTKRRVAIKVLKHGGFAGGREKIRFEREKDILAQLNHPNIVAIQDSGSAPGPYGVLHFFVMDYVSGTSLKTYLKRSRLGRDEVLTLFTKICDAVNAAHLRGVIHRDLKPDNIRIDQNNEPHILDFGLAKTMGSADEAGEAMTMTGDFLGTPLYAAPEQAARDPSRVDVRTDVHALGVMLFEALTGKLPYGAFQNWRDALDAIINQEPAQARSLSKQVNEEVNTIVAKAISKEPERRYQNAGELARDLRHYLAGEPIEAKSESAIYVIGKHLKRHRAGTTAALLTLIAIIVSAVVSTTFWRRAEAAGAAETVARQLAEQAKATAEEQRAQAVLQARRLERVQSLMSDLLGSADPDIIKGRDPAVVLETLAQASLRAKTQLAGEEPVLAVVMEVLGRSYLALGAVALAEENLQQSLRLRSAAAPDSLEVSASLLAIADLRRFERKSQAARQLAGDALKIREKILGPTSPAVADCLDRLGHVAWDLRELDEAKANYQRSLDIRSAQFGADSVEAAESLSNLGTVLTAQNRLDEALSVTERALSAVLAARGETSIAAAVCRANIASILTKRGTSADHDRAIREATAALDTYRKLFTEINPDHAYVCNALHKLAQALSAAGRNDEALKVVEEALERRRRSASANRFSIGTMQLTLGRILRKLGDFPKATAALDEARIAIQETRGGEHPTYAECVQELELAKQQKK